ncbi:MAG: SDR family oxidoreductase [Spirochaetales bacterium]|nr:SDR family oxidoreductase [Spirochaetales bacterium]
MKIDLTGKTAVVTGGSRGIGAAVCRGLAEAGARLVIDYLPNERDMAGLEQLEGHLKARGLEYESFAGDVTVPEEMEELCRLAITRFGGLDILVHCAGFTAPKSFGELDVEQWRMNIDVNLTGAFYVTRSAAGPMIARGSGRIIYIGSAGSITGGGGSAAYSAAKAGINGLVRALSKELAPRGITVNAVLPALIETDLLKDRAPDPAKREEYVKRVPVGRLGTPQDVAWLVLFLASEEAGFITAQNIIVDGGATYK